MLQVQNIAFAYQKEIILKDIEFTVPSGTCLAIIGESGCGKSTLLKLIYGLYDLEQGQIFWNENEVLGPKYHLIPGMEYMKFLAQDFDLMPFITVAENVGKYLSNIYPEVKQARIMELLDTVEMTEFAHTKAKYLSGGQMQRVALARVLALEPQVLLLDEPFSHIDNFRKNSLRRKLFRYLKSKKITTLIATHDSTDVLSFADTVLVMRDGSLVAEGTPTELFASENPYVASLFGDISMYSEKGTVHHAFPYQLQIASEGISAVVVQSYFRGSHYLLELQADTSLVLVEHAAAIPEGTSVFFNKKP